VILVIAVIVATAVMDEIVVMDVVMIVGATAAETVVEIAVNVSIAVAAMTAAVVSAATNAQTVVDVSNVDRLVDADQDRQPSCMSDSAAKLASVPKTWSERLQTKAASLVAISVTSKFPISSRSSKFRATRWTTS
jgi:hypothetical protein